METSPCTAESATAAEVRPWSNVLVELYCRHAATLVRLAERVVCDRAIAEECVHDVFLAFHAKQASPAPGCELAYLRTMVRNRAISVVRREARRREISERGEFDPVETMSAEAAVVASVMAGVIGDVLAGLAPQQRAVVGHRLLGKSVAETAEAMQVSSGTVKTHRHRAAEAVRLRLTEAVV